MLTSSAYALCVKFIHVYRVYMTDTNVHNGLFYFSVKQSFRVKYLAKYAL